MNTELLPAESTRTNLNFLEKQSLLVTIDNAFAQKVGPPCSPNGPMLEFDVVSDRENFMELQNFLLEMKQKKNHPNQ